MTRIARSRSLSLLVVVVVLCLTVATATAQTSSADLSKFFAQYFEEKLRDEPEFATTVGRHEYDDRWSDLSKQGREQRRAHMRQRPHQLTNLRGEGPSDQGAPCIP